MISKAQYQGTAMAVMTMIVLAIVIMIPMINGDKINCNTPSTWATAQGVEQCAINGGK